MQVTLSAIASKHAKPTQRMNANVNQLLDYAATHPNAITQYHASDMQLHIHSNANYLNEPGARS
jgi:hypothetical protein